MRIGLAKAGDATFVSVQKTAPRDPSDNMSALRKT